MVLLILLTCSGAAVHAEPDPVVETIQRALVERGFDPGKIDGAMGWRTRGAIRVFQRSSGLPDTGRADTATLEALGLTPLEAEESPVEADTPQTETSGMAAMPGPDEEPARTEMPDAGSTADTMQSETSPGPAPESKSDAPAAEMPEIEPPTRPGAAAGAPDPGSAAVADPARTPSTETPKSGTPDTAPTTEPDPATKTGTTDTKPDPVSDAVTSQAAKQRITPAAEPTTGAPKAGAPPAQAAPKPANKPKEAVRPRRVAEAKLNFASLDWHRPQTGREALERFTAIGAPRDFKRGTRSLFVPQSELVFVLKANERIPGLDCDPAVGKLSMEFVFGPDGPVIFTPVSGGEYCQMGIGIAIAVGRTLEMRRIDWGDEQYPPGTVRVTNEGLEYAR